MKLHVAEVVAGILVLTRTKTLLDSQIRQICE